MSVQSIGNSDATPPVAADPAWQRISHLNIEQAAILVDAVIVVAACFVWRTLFNGLGGVRPGVFALLAISSVVCASFIPFAKLRSLYHPSVLLSGHPRVWNVAALWLGVVALLGLAAFALESNITPQEGIAFAILGLLGLLAHRLFWHLFAKTAFAKGSLRSRKIVLISETSALSYSDDVHDLKRSGFEIEHSLHFDPVKDDPAFVRAKIDQAIDLSVNANIDELVIAADVRNWPQLKLHLECLRQLPLPVSLVVHGTMAELLNRPSHPLGSSILVEVQSPPLSVAERLLKRTIDLVFAAFAVMLLSPLMIVVALLSKLDSPGEPILFYQTRLGFNGKPFKIFKFRTMKVLEDGANIRQASPNDDRITGFGRLLRSTSIDELPQLFNVLKGDMSIVGPRPHARAHDIQFGRIISDYAFRRKMKPGITGLAQVNGYRGATPQTNLMDSRVRLDIRYIENWSIWLDIKIIARTVVEVILRTNAY